VIPANAISRISSLAVYLMFSCSRKVRCSTSYVQGVGFIGLTDFGVNGFGGPVSRSAPLYVSKLNELFVFVCVQVEGLRFMCVCV